MQPTNTSDTEPTPTTAVFISYRRDDSPDITGRIYDRLVERFGEARVFKDVDSIHPGMAFADYIVDAVHQSAVELVIIGPRWLNAVVGWNRLDDPADFVRLEIETALRQGVALIPVLVMGATFPPAQRLPGSLQQLVGRNGLQVRSDPDFRHDMERLIAAIEYWMARPRPEPTPTASPAPTTPAVSAPPAAAPAPAVPLAAAPTAPGQLQPSPWPSPLQPQLPSPLQPYPPPPHPPAVAISASASPPNFRPISRPAPPSRPRQARWRALLLATLAVVLVTGSLGVLLTQKLAGDAARAIAAQGTQTANSSSTGTAAANTSATATAAAHASATAMAQAVHYPYRAAALGPG